MLTEACEKRFDLVWLCDLDGFLAYGYCRLSYRYLPLIVPDSPLQCDCSSQTYFCCEILSVKRENTTGVSATDARVLVKFSVDADQMSNQPNNTLNPKP